MKVEAMSDNIKNVISGEESVAGALVTSSSDKPSLSDDYRLPCRGCTRSCTDYDRCDGRPWRLVE